MKKSAACIAVSIFFCLIFMGMPRGSEGSPGDLISKVQPSTVKITVYDRTGKPVSTGSGFLFKAEGHLITNYHVLGNAAMAKVTMADGRECSIKAIVGEGRADDLIEAVIEIPSGGMRYLKPAGTAPKPGDPVMVIGSPFGVDKAVSQGSVTSIQEVQKYGRCIVHSAHSFPGSSGSPLVNAQGEVIGIETAAVPGMPDINVAVPLERFCGLSPNYRQLQACAIRAPAVAQTSSLTDVTRGDARMADPGDPAAQVKLAMMHEQGRGVSKNCFEALSLYRQAASQGSVEADYHIGRMYYDGKCSGQNLGEAIRHMQKAADRGFPEAQRFLGLLCFNGEGTPRDKVRACMWLMLAASRGSGEAQKLLRLVSSEMTQDELKAAREKAENWRPLR